ncbi:hypothetical protein [Embleya sp. AB8]|uniref:hypothetical protein n=1 Tax=Embleya sp. AB8 TaxID=3156304 RepID=UPI003C734734
MIGVDVLLTRIEIDKLARLLEVPAERLDFLHDRPAADVRRFREQTTATLFDTRPDMLDRIARATKLVPAVVAATISQKALGPQLAARVAGRLEAARAVDIIERVPLAFAVAATPHLDPRQVRDLVDRLDEDLLVGIARALADAGDFVTMGRFVGRIPDGALRRILAEVDDTVVLRAGCYIDDAQCLDHVVDLLGPDRLESVIRSAAAGLWPEALTVAGLVGPGHRVRIARLTARQDPDRLDSLVLFVHEQGLWEALLPLVALLDPDDLRAVAELPTLRIEEVLGAVVRAVVATRLWAEFLPLVEVLPEPSRAVIASAAGRLTDAELDALVGTVSERDLWDVVLPLMELMDDGAKERILALPVFREYAEEESP